MFLLVIIILLPSCRGILQLHDEIKGLRLINTLQLPCMQGNCSACVTNSINEILIILHVVNIEHIFHLH